MPWIKRNLYFLISCVLAVVLLGAAGWYCYTQWQGNNQSWDLLNQAYSDLKTLNSSPITPTTENIDAARAEAKQAQELASGLRKFLTPIPSIPNTNKIDDRALAFAMSDTIRQLMLSAEANHVELPQDFAFSFSAQRGKVVYAALSRDQLARQLGEVKAICDVLFTNRINSLQSLQRERTADDLAGGGGTTPEYLEFTAVTNNNTIIAPYEVSFLCFDQELSGVLSGFANERHGMIVRTLGVEPAEAATTEGGAPQTPTMPEGYGPRGYGPRGYGGMTPGMPQAQETTIGGLPVVVDEKKLKVTMLLELVRIIPTPGR